MSTFSIETLIAQYADEEFPDLYDEWEIFCTTTPELTKSVLVPEVLYGHASAMLNLGSSVDTGHEKLPLVHSSSSGFSMEDTEYEEYLNVLTRLADELTFYKRVSIAFWEAMRQSAPEIGGEPYLVHMGYKTLRVFWK